MTTEMPTSAKMLPSVSEIRRPRRAASVASGMAQTAAPSVRDAVAKPDKDSSPEISLARSAPSETVAPKATAASNLPCGEHAHGAALDARDLRGRRVLP